MQFPRSRTPTIALLAPLLLAAFAPPQDSPARQESPNDTPLPPGVAARVDDLVITLEQYKDHLLRVYGAGPLDDLIYAHLLRREAERLDVSITEEQLDREDQRFWDRFLIRFRGDPEAMRHELATAGFTPETYRAKLRVDTRRKLLEAGICVSARTITDEDLRARFDLLYGKDGVKVEVRQVLFTRPRTKAELRQRSIPDHELSNERLDAEMEVMAAEALRRLGSGEDLAAVARSLSHDISVYRNGGLIPAYNYERYGPELARAVRAAEVGAITGPLRTPAGLHVFAVTSRVTTRLEDARAEILGLLAQEPATWRERNDLRARLWNQALIRKFR